MKQVLISGGAVKLEEVPAPLIEPGHILVQVDHSCISIGTEMSGIKSTGIPLWKKALNQPQHVHKVLQMLVSEGFEQTRRVVQDRLGVELPIGYSVAGVVVEVGEGVDDFSLGDRVACAGAQCAYHAEVVRIPKNLAVRIPQDVGFDEASTVALGSIALQGVRRANPTLGELFVVIGLGVLGQLTAQMLRANGCQVVGIDLDRNRIEQAMRHGLTIGVHPDDVDDIAHVIRLTNGNGADGVIITAAAPSDSLISTAFQMCRKKARVVLVGDVGLDLKRADIYEKELDFLISTSYGPGRYERLYEEDGLDYPIGYVRWTENRNMAEYVRMIAVGSVQIKPLISAAYPISKVKEAYQQLNNPAEKPLMVLLAYPNAHVPVTRRVMTGRVVQHLAKDLINIALIGAGGFAKGMHLPNLFELKTCYRLQAVASRNGHNAATVAKRFDASYCTTDYKEILQDKDIDAVLIATRHDTHARIALDSLQCGKHVLLEKPLALSEDELTKFEDFYAETSPHKPLLLTGFNRRFSPYMKPIMAQLKLRTNPMIINYRMNAGYIPPTHWVHSEEGGGRNKGEACHIYDLFTFLTDARVIDIQAKSLRPKTAYYLPSDNFVVSLAFEDGSLATLTYTALGSTDHPKELMEIYVDGTVIVLNDYRQLTIAGGKQKPMNSRQAEKGQKEELVEFARAVKGETDWPSPFWHQLQATRISFEVDRLLNQQK